MLFKNFSILREIKTRLSGADSAVTRGDALGLSIQGTMEDNQESCEYDERSFHGDSYFLSKINSRKCPLTY
jgi:hypothetical protein